MSAVYSGIGLLWGAVGGVILGLSTSLYLVTIGRVTGMSQTVKTTYKSLTRQGDVDPIHITYFGGLLLGGAIMSLAQPDFFEQGGYSPVVMVPGGILTGLGTTIGYGCTSGHGLCGLARLSKRSLVAVATFFCVGLIVASSTETLFRPYWKPRESDIHSVNYAYSALAVGLAFIITGSVLSKNWLQITSVVICSVLFAVGLAVSGMVKATKIHGFLALKEGWDPSLAFVMAGGLAINLLFYPYILKWNAPKCREEFDLPQKTEFEWELVIGGTIFGIGWAIGGLCPGPGLVGVAGKYGLSYLIWIAGLLFGVQIGLLVKSAISSYKRDQITSTTINNRNLPPPEDERNESIA